jgi:hypothetical protein
MMMAARVAATAEAAPRDPRSPAPIDVLSSALTTRL